MTESYMETVERINVISTECDCCKETIQVRSSYDRAEVKIRVTEGDVFPEGGSIEVIEPDICIDCWNDKIAPALTALGIPLTKHLINV